MLKRSIFVRVTAPTLVVSLVLLLSSTVVSIFLYKQQAATARDYGENVDSREAAREIELELGGLDMLLKTAQDPVAVRDVAEKYHRDLRTFLDEADQLADKPFERQLVAETATSFDKHINAWSDAIEQGAVQQSDLKTAINILETETIPSCVRLREFNALQIKTSRAEHHANVERMIWGLLAVAGIGSLSGIFLGYGVSRMLRRSLYHLSVRVRDAADRLGHELPPVTIDEDSDLRGMTEQMTMVVHEVEEVVKRLQQREREVLRADQLASVGQVAAGVAHELRNPLTSIKLLVQKNRRQLGSHELPSENLQIIEQEIRRMERCLQTFLDFARPPKPDRRTTNLASVVDRTLALIEGRARKQQVQVQFAHNAESIDAAVDPEQLHQLLVNLALNALDAMPNGGTLSVEVTRRSNNGAEICVRDTGPGISSLILPRLFEPFVSSKETGVGLGLVVSRRIAEEHGGNLTAHNCVEGGACFTVSLPLSENGRT
jgi:two-component system sensor histidine kinase HydH